MMRHKKLTKTKSPPSLICTIPKSPPPPLLPPSFSPPPSLSLSSMRIRRRPQQSSSSPIQPSDPSTSTAPQTPQNAARNQEWRFEGGKEEGRLHASVDLGQKSGVARRLALPQDNAVGGVKSLGAEQGADDTHRSVANGHHGGTDRKDDVACTGEWPKVEGAVRNGVAAAPAVTPAVMLAVKDEKNGGDGSGGGAGGAKKRRGPAVLMEGSRCSRVNGRGWRCSQPTLVGYSLCEHHLGKGRMRSATAAAAAAGGGGGGRGGAGQLGRTEHRARIPAAVGAATTPAPHAEEPSLRRC